MTGEDALFYSAIADGADGGILASAHSIPGIRDDALTSSPATGSRAAPSGRTRDIVGLLFAEPSPAPIKHWLWRRAGLPRRSCACR